MDKQSGRIVALACGKGREHDFKLFKRRRPRLHEKSEVLADSGYQGLAKFQPKCRTPHKRRRKTIALTNPQRAHNRQLASERVGVEHAIRRLKVFRILKETYRHRRRRHGLRAHLLAGLTNHDLLAKA